MLQSMHDAAKSGVLKYILMGMLVLAGGGLVLTDVGGFFRGGVGVSDVAKAGSATISIQEFDKNVRRALGQQGISPQQAYRYGFMDQILENEIRVRLMTQQASSLGLKISDEIVTSQIQKMALNLGQDEESRKEALSRILRQQGVTENEFVTAMRQETANGILRNALLSAVAVTPSIAAQDLYQFDNEKRDLDIISIKDSSVMDIKQPDEASLKTYYEANKLMYAIPETRKITIATLNKAMVEDKIDVTDEQLQAHYDQNIDSFMIPEQRLIEQGVLKTEDEAIKIMEQVKSGKGLKDLLEDPKSYLGEDEFEFGGLLEDIAIPVFEAAKGDVVGPIETPFGWHVLIIKEILEPSKIPFNDVKTDLKKELLAEQTSEALIETANLIDDRLASGEELKAIVTEIGLTTETFGPFKADGLDSKGTDLFAAFAKDKMSIIEAAYGYDTGESAPIMELSDGRFAVVRVDEITPESHKSFEQVKDQLSSSWIEEQKSIMNKTKVQEAFSKIKSGKTLEDAAKELKAEIVSQRGISRIYEENVKTGLDANILEQAFSLPVGESLMAPIEGGYAIIRIANVSLPAIPDSKDNQSLKEVSDKLAQLLPQETMNTYIDFITKKEKVKVNRALLDKMYGGEENAN